MNKPRYVRGLPCNIAPENDLWCIVGALIDEDGTPVGGGILEWCYDETDANHLLSLIKDDPAYGNLRAQKYNNSDESEAYQRQQANTRPLQHTGPVELTSLVVTHHVSIRFDPEVAHEVEAAHWLRQTLGELRREEVIADESIEAVFPKAERPNRALLFVVRFVGDLDSALRRLRAIRGVQRAAVAPPRRAMLP